MKPLVSILVANYNNSKYIAETLDSAISQQYQNIEIIIVDDKSTDDSILVIKNYIQHHREYHISLFCNSTNLGCGGTKRKCIEYSKGEYFTFLDPEDTITIDAISLLMEYHLGNKSLGIVYCTHFLCNEKLNPQSISNYPGAIPDGQSHLTSTSGHISALAICRRHYYNLTSGINPEYKVSEDQDLYLKIEEVSKVKFVDKPLYYYRKHDHNTSWNESKKYINQYWSYKCKKAAYKRRLSIEGIDNLTKYEMIEIALSFHIANAKECKINHLYINMIFQYLIASNYYFIRWIMQIAPSIYCQNKKVLR